MSKYIRPADYWVFVKTFEDQSISSNWVFTKPIVVPTAVNNNQAVNLGQVLGLVGGGGVWGSITGSISSQTDLQTALGGKQATLVSGTNIKTINSTSLLGSGDIAISGGTGAPQVELFPHTIATGAGTEVSPYTHADNTGGIQTEINALAAGRGGSVKLSSSRFNVTSQITITTPCIKINGVVAGMNIDPNAESQGISGTSLIVTGNGISIAGASAVGRIQGVCLDAIYLYGTTAFQSIGASTGTIGIKLQSYIDEPHIDHVNLGFFDYGIKIVNSGSGWVDFSYFNHVVLQNCRVGVYYDNIASYGHHYLHCAFAETQEHNFYVSVSATNQFFLFDGCAFYRGSTSSGVTNPANVYFGGNNSRFIGCEFQQAGHPEFGGTNQPADGLILAGSYNTVTGCAFINNSVSSSYGIRITGSNNVIAGNTYQLNKSDIIVSGNNNYIEVPPGVTITNNGTGNVIVSTSTMPFYDVNSNIYVNNSANGLLSQISGGAYTLNIASEKIQVFTGSSTTTVTMPVVSTFATTGLSYKLVNLSTGALTVNSSGGNLITTVQAGGASVEVICQLITGTTAASWTVPSSGGVTGSDGYIQTNVSGIFGSSPNATINSSTGAVYFKGPNYTTFTLNAPNYPGINFQSNGSAAGCIGGGQSNYFTGNTDTSYTNTGGNISVEGSHVFIGGGNTATGVQFSNTGTFGVSANSYLAYGFSGINNYMYFVYNTAGSTFKLANAENELSSPTNANDFLFGGNVDIGFFSGVSTDTDAYLKGFHTTRNVSIGSGTNNGTDDATNKVQLYGNLALKVAGNKILIATGTNASAGTATLVSGTVTISTTAVTTSSLIFAIYNTPSGTLASGLSVPVGSITGGTSFVINSLTTAGIVNTSDNSTVRWWFIN